VSTSATAPPHLEHRHGPALQRRLAAGAHRDRRLPGAAVRSAGPSVPHHRPGPLRLGDRPSALVARARGRARRAGHLAAEAPHGAARRPAHRCRRRRPRSRRALVLLTATPFGMGALVAPPAGAGARSRAQRVRPRAGRRLHRDQHPDRLAVRPAVHHLPAVHGAASRRRRSRAPSTSRSSGAPSHPLFFFLENPRSQIDEVGLTLRWGVVVGLLAAAGRSPAPTPAPGAGAPGARWRAGAHPRHDGLRPRRAADEPAHGRIVAPACTLLGLAFALLGQRSRFGRCAARST
jgi:hypothetical protein